MKELGRWMVEAGTMERAPSELLDPEQWASDLLNQDSRVRGRMAELRIFAAADWWAHPKDFANLDEIGFAFQTAR